MGRKRKITLKKYIFDKFYVNVDSYKNRVAYFNIRFNYKQEGETNNDVSKLKKEMETLFKKEYQYLERSRHILEIEMVDMMRQCTARCSLNGYFLIFDNYEDYVLKHAQELMNKLQTMFNQMNFQIISPQKNNIIETY